MDPNHKSHNSTLRPLSLKRQAMLQAGTLKQKPRTAIRKKTLEQIKAEGKSVIQRLLGEGKITKAIDMHRAKKEKPRKKLNKFGTSALASLDGQLTVLFNRWVRLMARDEKGMVRCFICHRLIPYEESEAMHFQARQGRGIRFSIEGVRAGCHSCNAKPNGDRKNFAKRLEEEKPGLSSTLTILSKQVMRYDREWYREQIALYKDLNEKLERL